MKTKKQIMKMLAEEVAEEKSWHEHFLKTGCSSGEEDISYWIWRKHQAMRDVLREVLR